MAGKEAQTVANLLVNEMIAYLKGAGVSLTESGIAPAQVAALAKLLATDAISSNQAHEVFEAMAQTGDDPNKIVDERGMRQVSDAGALQPIVDEVLANCADQAQQYRDGNQKVIGFLVGQCMKASRGKGNPKLFNEVAENVALVSGNSAGGASSKFSNSPAQDEGHIVAFFACGTHFEQAHACRGSRVLQRLGRSGQVG